MNLMYRTIAVFALTTAQTAEVNTTYSIGEEMSAGRILDQSQIDAYLNLAITRERMCGPFAVAAVLRCLGHDVGLKDIAAEIAVASEGASLQGLLNVACEYEASAEVVSAGRLGGIRAPAILILDGRHAVVLVEWHGDSAVIADSALKELHIFELDALERRWSGLAMTFSPHSVASKTFLRLGVFAGGLAVLLLIGVVQTSHRST